MSQAGDPAVRAWASTQARTVTGRAAPAPPSLVPPVRSWLPGTPVRFGAFSLADTWGAHDQEIDSLAWAVLDDGRPLLATASDDRTVRIWDGDAGDLLHTLAGHEGTIWSVAWAVLGDGQLLLATGSSDTTVRIWDGRTGAELHTLTGHSAAVNSVAWAVLPDGLLLATGADDRTVRIWDGNTGALLHTLTGHTQRVWSVSWAVLPDELLLATGSEDRTVRIWDGHTGAEMRTLSSYSDAVITAEWAVLPDGRLWLAVGGDDGTAQIWDWRTSDELQTLSVGTKRVWAASWAVLGDGRLLLATSSAEGSVQVWDGNSGDLLHAIPGPSERVMSAAWAVLPDGGLLLAAGRQDGSACVWHPELDPPVPPATAAPVSTAEASETTLDRIEEISPGDWPEAADISVTAVAWAALPDGQLLLATGGPNGTAWLRDGHTGALLHTLTGHTDMIRSVAWAVLPDGQLMLATGSNDDTARIWDGHTGALLHTLTGHTDRINSVAWAVLPDGLLLATGSEDNTARIWDGHAGALLHTITGHAQRVWSVAFAVLGGGQVLLATGSEDNTARIWDGHTGALLNTFADDTRAVYCVAWAPLADGRLLLATANGSNGLLVRDGRTGALLQTLTDSLGPMYYAAWAVLPDGRLLVAASGEPGGDTTRIWDANSSSQLATLPHAGNWGDALTWAFLPDGRLWLAAASTSEGKLPTIWDVSLIPPVAARPAPPGAAQAGTAAELARGGLGLAGAGVLAFGAADLWLPLGLIADLVTLTGSDWTEGRELNDGRLRALAGNPGVGRLRSLGWPAGARVSLAGLLASGVSTGPEYEPPLGTPAGVLRDALAVELARPGPVRLSHVDLAGLQAAAAAVTDQMITLLTIVGPDAAAADPVLALRLASHAPGLPVLAGHQLRLLAGAARPEAGQRADRGGLVQVPGTAGIGWRGQLTQLLATQLALPTDLLTARYLQGHLLYRQHTGRLPPVPEPFTLILDTTPPTFGPAENVLRLAAHLITTTLWEHGEYPLLISLTCPGAARPLTTRADLAQLWTTRTLDPPGPALVTAVATATATGRPVVMLAHYRTPGQGYLPGPRRRLLTTHQPPESAPRPPAQASHRHLPPNVGETQLSTAIQALITPDPSRPR